MIEYQEWGDPGSDAPAAQECICGCICSCGGFWNLYNNSLSGNYSLKAHTHVVWGVND